MTRLLAASLTLALTSCSTIERTPEELAAAMAPDACANPAVKLKPARCPEPKSKHDVPPPTVHNPRGSTGGPASGGRMPN
jgi:hypothetical protein